MRSLRARGFVSEPRQNFHRGHLTEEGRRAYYAAAEAAAAPKADGLDDVRQFARAVRVHLAGGLPSNVEVVCDFTHGRVEMHSELFRSSKKAAAAAVREVRDRFIENVNEALKPYGRKVKPVAEGGYGVWANYGAGSFVNSQELRGYSAGFKLELTPVEQEKLGRFERTETL